MVDFSVIKKDLKNIGKLPPEKKLAIVFILIILFIVSYSVSKSLSNRNLVTQGPGTADESGTASAQMQPRTGLTISPVSKNLSIGKQEKLEVVLSKLPVTAVDIVLTFDPTLVDVTNVQNGPLFQRVLQNKVDNGKIIFSAAVTPQNATNTKEGTVFTFMVKAKKEAPAALIGFDPRATVAALNGENMLGSTVGGTYKIVK